MEINSWFTLISIFLVVVSIVPPEILKIKFYGTTKLTLIIGLIFFAIDIVLVPFLIFFDRLIIRLPVLKIFTYSNGFEPKNIAFILVYVSILWLIWTLLKQKIKANDKVIGLYEEILNNKKFVDFFHFFSKYSQIEEIKNEWENYEKIILNPLFLNEIIKYKPYYILDFLHKFKKDDFKILFKLYLMDTNSVYYSEIKNNWNYSTILDNHMFLKSILVENLAKSIDNDMIIILIDYINEHLNKTNYNRMHYIPEDRANEGYELHIYYHIKFIDLLYSTAIYNNFDIVKESKYYLNNSIYRTILNRFLDKMRVDNTINTDYHWLIRQIFSIQSNWINMLNDSKNNEISYIDFIPSSIQDCLKELNKAYRSQKISLDFYKEIIRDTAFNRYFYKKFNKKIRENINDKILAEIPKEIRNEVINYAVHEEQGVIDIKEAIKENHSKKEQLEALLQIMDNS